MKPIKKILYILLVPGSRLNVEDWKSLLWLEKIIDGLVIMARSN